MEYCEVCQTKKAKIHLGSNSADLHLCSDCYNQLMAEELALDLKNIVDKFTLIDPEGVRRTFFIDRVVYPTGIYLEAAEDLEYGYKFAVHGELGCNQQELLTRLITKTKKGVETKHLKTVVFPNEQISTQIIHDQFIGLIEYNEDSQDTPIIIIDGKPYTWDEVGKMLMSYEGFQMKVKLFEMTDDE